MSFLIQWCRKEVEPIGQRKFLILFPVYLIVVLKMQVM